MSRPPTEEQRVFALEQVEEAAQWGDGWQPEIGSANDRTCQFLVNLDPPHLFYDEEFEDYRLTAVGATWLANHGG